MTGKRRAFISRHSLALFTLIFLPLICTGGDWSQRLDPLGPVADMTATPMPHINPSDPTQRRVGLLTYLGGVRLTSPDPVFGGYSSLSVVGDRFVLLSDGGYLVRFRMGADWRLHAVSFANLPGGPGIGWAKQDRDSESMTFDWASNRVWVGFENWNQIWRYDAAFTRAEAWAAPAAMKKWPPNEGPESMVRLRSGSFVVLAETWPSHSKARTGLWFSGDPTRHPVPAFQFRYLPPEGYDPSDMTELPDGRLLVINRAFTVDRELFHVRLTLISPDQIRPNALVRGREVAALARPLLHDNFEGVSAQREGKDTVIWIVSDDNQQLWQQTLLLKFRLDG